MSTNKMINHLVTVRCLPGTDIGSGVIFASHDKSSYYYILTAKHNFPDCLTDPSKYGNHDLEIHFQKKAKIKTNELKVFFPSEQDDLALIVFKSEETDLLKNVKSLKIYNTDPETDYKNTFVVIGYPSRNTENDFAQPHDNVFARINGYDKDSRLEILKDDGASTTHAIKLGQGYYAGMSGGAVFFEDQYKELQLRSIIKQYSGDSFSCVRLDQLIDSINSSIQQYSKELDIIEMGDLLFAGDEPIEIDEISDFDFFKGRINDRLKSSQIWSKYGFSEFEHKNYDIDKESLRGIAEDLRKHRDRIRKETDELSYLFAYIAIASHSNKDYRLSTNYFLEATRLNPKHTQTLLLEKHDRKDKINNIEATSLADLERKYELLLAKEQHDNLAARRSILIDALDVARTFDDKQDSLVISKFEEKLIENYKRDDSLRDHHKYKELGDYFYNTRSNGEEFSESAFKYHTVSLKVAKLSPQSEQVVSFIKDFQETYNSLYNESCLRENLHIISESAAQAVDIILADEDPRSQRLLLRVSEEIDDLKALSINQGMNAKEQVRILSSIGTEIGTQAHLTHQSNARIEEANENIVASLEQSKGINDAIGSVRKEAKGLSSQLLRVEHSALKLAHEFSTRLEHEPSEHKEKIIEVSFFQKLRETTNDIFLLLAKALMLVVLLCDRSL